MARPKIATAHLSGCFGCNMSLLDIDERLLELCEAADLDKSPLTDFKSFTGPCDIGFIEGGCSTSENVHVLREFRKHCRVMVSVGACAINGNIPALRNPIPLRECLEEAFVESATVRGGSIPDDPELPLLLDKVYPCHEVVAIDYFLPGCPPSAEAIWATITAILEGRQPVLPYEWLKYD